MTFAEVVKDSHRCCCDKCMDWPTDCMIAEDIVDHYSDYSDVDLSDPYKYNDWVKVVRIELNKQGLCYQEDK